MQFLIQTDRSGVPKHDFAYIVYKAVEYQREFNDRDDVGYTTCLGIYSDIDAGAIPLPKGIITPSVIRSLKKEDTIIPIGSIEFVQEFCDSVGLELPLPINVPDDLLHKEFLKREIFYTDKWIPQNNKKYFFKDASVLKGLQGIIEKGGIIYTNNEKSPNDLFLISEWIDIDSEWRVFVHKDHIVDIRRYSGDLDLFPDIDKISDMITSYKNSPVAYTLDVAITANGDTVLIECHDFYSVGLYGFDNYNKVPFMFSQWWYQNAIQDQQ